jgi:uncharacterized protein
MISKEKPMMHRTIALAAAVGALALPAAAQAHVTLAPNTAPAGAFTVESVRVPNEQDKANTVKVDVQLPPGFVSVSYEQQPGWTVKVTRTKLAKPVKTDDGLVTEQVSRITWTGDGKQGKIAPGQFQDFPLSVQVPGKAGETLTFKALQTYDNGDVVRWIGAPSAAEPAPRVQVTAAAGEHAAATGAGSTATPPAAASDSGSRASKGLGIAALAAGILGLLLGLAGLVAGRRRSMRGA